MLFPVFYFFCNLQFFLEMKPIFSEKFSFSNQTIKEIMFKKKFQKS
jgi:hypothetical protein